MNIVLLKFFGMLTASMRLICMHIVLIVYNDVAVLHGHFVDEVLLHGYCVAEDL